MQEIIEKFKRNLLVNGLSYSTITNYSHAINQFSKQVDLSNITTEKVVNYFFSLKDKLAPNSINIYKNALISFLSFANITDVKVPKMEKIPKRLPEFITLEFFEDDVLPMLETICQRPLKVKTILYFMFYTGLRVGEVASLKREDLDLKNKTVKVYSKKTKRERIIPFPKKVKDILELFFSIEEEEKGAFNITKGGIQSIFKLLNPYFEGVNLHSHGLRHSAATHWRKRGIAIENIQYLLGHASISSTMIYAHADNKAILDDFRKKVK